MEKFHISDITPINISKVAEPDIKYSICTLVTSEIEYAEMRGSFECSGFSGTNSEYLFVDNTKGNSLDGYEAYRKFRRIAKGKYIIYCHQDVLAIDTINVLDRKIEELEKLDPCWAIAGNAGASTIRSFFKYFVNGSNEHEIEGFKNDLPVKVASLDENLLVIKSEAGLSTSSDLHGYHFYGTDLCINADILGYSCYVFKFLVQHKSFGNKNEAFWGSRDLFISKYTRALRTRIIQTTCARLGVAGNSLIVLLANTTIVLFIVKVYIKIRNILH
jgi:hypothetical protein